MFTILSIVGGVGGKMISSALGNILSKGMSEKVVMKIIIILITKLVNSSKNDLDDKIWGELKKELERDV